MQSLGNDKLLIDYSIGGMTIIGGGPAGRPSGSASAPGGSEGSGAVAAGPISSAGSDSETQGEARQAETAQRGSASFSMNQMSNKTSLLELSSGRLIAELPIEGVSAVVADSESLYVLDSSGSVKKYSLSDGTPVNKSAVNLGGGNNSGGLMFMMPGGSGSLLAVDGDGNLYALYDGNLLCQSPDGEVVTLLEGTACSIGAPSSNAISVFSIGGGSFVVDLLINMQTNRLYKYVWDANATTAPEKTLSVWSLEENAFVRAAIAELRKKNPDSYITYEVAMGGNNAVSASDAIKTLNTRLLSGSGPDIIILDGCPAASYADRGMLADLSTLVDTGDVYQNLIAPYITDGKIYFWILTQGHWLMK